MKARKNSVQRLKIVSYQRHKVKKLLICIYLHQCIQKFLGIITKMSVAHIKIYLLPLKLYLNQCKTELQIVIYIMIKVVNNYYY